jgi:hypothetical protein
MDLNKYDELDFDADVDKKVDLRWSTYQVFIESAVHESCSSCGHITKIVLYAVPRPSLRRIGLASAILALSVKIKHCANAARR